jgi:predicted RecA/RadA family phage recombinase
MSTNFIEKGEVLNYSATTKNISSGDLVIIGSIAGVAKTDIAIGETGAVHITGVYSLAKANDTITQGAKVYWNNINSNVTTNKLDSVLIGVAANNTISSDDFAQILLNIGL